MAAAQKLALPTVGPLSGTALIAACNAIFRTLEQSNLGSIAPEEAFLGKLWTDNSNATLISLKIYDGNQYVEIGQFNTTTHMFTATNAVFQKISTLTGATPELTDLLMFGDVSDTNNSKKVTITDLFGLMTLGGIGVGINADVSSTDLNNLDKTGFYRGATLTNAPAASSASFTILHMKIDGTAATQYATRLNTGESYIRVKSSSVWAAWRRIDYSLATAAQVRAGTDNVNPVSSNAIWSAIASVAVSWTSTVTLDFSAGENFTIGTMTGNTILGAPTSRKSFQKGTIVLTQDTTGGRTLGFNSVFVFPSEIPFVIDTTPKCINLLHYECFDTNYVYISGVRRVKTLP